MMWVNKYRPYNINNVIQQDDIKNLILNSNNLNNIPHLLFYGQSGIGKTSSALAICNYLFLRNSKNKNYDQTKILKERVLELNASNDRGIKVVREKIKSFAVQAINKYENIPNFKIIILDEADTMTDDSQYALRRIIEQYSYITRFIIICNYVSKIIAPLSSRCSKYKFNPISINNTKFLLNNIINNENILINDDNIINCICKYSNGDLRKAITILQRADYISKINNEFITLELIKEILCIVPDDYIYKLYNLIIDPYMDIYNISKYINNLINYSYPSLNIILELQKMIMLNTEINDNNKSLINIKISSINNCLINGSDNYLQLLSLVIYINFLLYN
jgi:replication factor C subunit 2/4